MLTAERKLCGQFFRTPEGRPRPILLADEGAHLAAALEECPRDTFGTLLAVIAVLPCQAAIASLQARPPSSGVAKAMQPPGVFRTEESVKMKVFGLNEFMVSKIFR